MDLSFGNLESLWNQNSQSICLVEAVRKLVFWTTKKDICANPDQEQHVTLFVKSICKRMNEYNLNPTEYPY